MFQQQVEEIKFEQVYIQKIKQKALKTNKIRDWLSLLKAYHQNNLLEQKDKTIETMHFKFILNEQFWLEQIDRKLRNKPLTEKDIEFVMMAFDDGYYERAAEKVNKILIHQLNEAQKNQTKLRNNYLIAKIQKIISIYKQSKNFLNGLRKYYQDLGNAKKVRQLFYRELKLGLDNHDVVFDEYTLWEKQNAELQKSLKVYEQSKQTWQKQLDSSFYCLDYLNMVDNKNLYDSVTYLKMIQSLETDTQKLRYLRIACLGRHDLSSEYFQKLQSIYKHDEQYVINCYKNVLEIIPETQILYLRFLVRRINKHVQSKQDEEYNSKWGQKVQYFRQEIAELIDKPRLTPKTQQSIREVYYNYWIDVETALIKDKQSVCQLFQVLLQTKSSVELYTKYSQCLVKLGSLGDAKNVLKRSCLAFKYHFEAYKQYQNFISVYGNIDDFINFRTLKSLFKSQMQQQISNTANGETIISNGTSIQNKQHKQTEHRQATSQKKQQQINKQNRNQRVKKFQISQQRQKIKSKGNNNNQTRQNNEQKQARSNGDTNQVEMKEEKMEPQAKKMHVDSGSTLFIKGFPHQWRENQIRNIIRLKESIKQIRLVQKNGVYKNYCYVQMSNAEDAQSQVQSNLNSSQYSIAISKPPSAFSQQKTLFLCALPISATTQKIKNLFVEQNPKIVDIRLKIDNNKSIAYVDFQTAEIAKQALQKYSHKQLTIDDKKILIRQSNSSKFGNHKKQYRVVMLKKLAFKAQQKDIINFFSDYNIEDVYIPQNQQGKSKGFAFVKFKRDDEFRHALSMKKGTIKNRQFEIHKSDRDIVRPKKQEKAQKKGKQQQINNNYFNNLFK